MELPAIIQGESGKRLFQGMAVGAVATMFVGFYWGGWVLGSTAREMNRTGSAAAAISALVPICVDRFQQASGASDKLAELKKTSSWQQGAFVEKGGWATFPGNASPDTGVAKACAETLSSLKS